MPRPWVLVTTPKPIATSRATAAPAPRAPPPSHSSGRRAAAKASARRSIWSAAGAETAGATGVKLAGSSTSSAWMSIGTSTLTGPQGAVKASRTACWKVARAASALRTRQAFLLTALSMFSWSRASWM